MSETKGQSILCGKKEAAALLNVSVRTIDNLLKAKELRARKVGARVLIQRSELERFALRDHKTAA